MLSYLKSEDGKGAALRNFIFLFIIIIIAFVIFQIARTKIKIADMEQTVQEQATGAKRRESWDPIIIDRLLRKAVDLDIITPDDVASGTWREKMEITIQRPMADHIEITVIFDMTTDFLVWKKTDEVVIEASAKIYES